MSTIISTISLVLRELITQFQVLDSDLKYVYDPNLSFETGMRHLRANKNFNEEITNSGEHPLLMFNRSPLRLIGDRFTDNYQVIDNQDNDAGTSTTHTIALGEFDFRFSYTNPNQITAEAFEVNYIAEKGLRSLNITTPDLSSLDITGDMQYDLTWQPLEDLIIESEGNYYKSVLGSVVVRGMFVVTDGAGKLIQTISADIEGWYGEVYRNLILTE